MPRRAGTLLLNVRLSHPPEQPELRDLDARLRCTSYRRLSIASRLPEGEVAARVGARLPLYAMGLDLGSGVRSSQGLMAPEDPLELLGWASADAIPPPTHC